MNKDKIVSKNTQEKAQVKRKTLPRHQNRRDEEQINIDQTLVKLMSHLVLVVRNLPLNSDASPNYKYMLGRYPLPYQ